MKILQIFNQYRFRGGEEMWVDGMAELLGDSAELDELRFSSKDWVGVNAPSPLKQICLMGDNPASRAALRERVASFKPDVLLFHNVIPVGSFGLFKEAKSLEVPVLYYMHNFRPFSPSGTMWDGEKMVDAALRGNPWPEILSGAWQGSRIKTAILAWHLHRTRKKGLLDMVDRWIAPSAFMRDKFIAAGVPAEKISLVRHCWGAGTEEPATEEGTQYLFLGRLVSEKGVHLLLDAWTELEATLGEACPKLCIAGTGPEEELLRQRGKLLKTLSMPGFVSGEEKAQLIRTCRAMLIPSICWESLGLTAYEAYAASRPVIAARAGALEETVTDGVTGWLHEAGSAKDLARAIISAEQAGK
jgi:glycosyltransferase involved in cell wall biosynthesis